METVYPLGVRRWSSMPNLLDNHLVVTLLLGLYAVVVLMVCVYGMHRYQLVHLYYKYRRNTPQLNACFLDHPRVTIQLPMYNEEQVARRIIDATCEIDYPRDR
ncbi:MAG: hypothetical protein HY718_01300, partial [Planctomycetes bacterium]|nr:hypothetical protein [Planctomycetota bacterium]